MKNIFVSRIEETDIVVIGSGSSGILASVAAARSGNKVTIVEKYGFLGGISTGVIDTMNGFYTIEEKPRKIVSGITDEILYRLRKEDSLLERYNTFGTGVVITYNQDILKCVYDDMAVESNVDIRMHTTFMDVVMEGEHIKGVIVLGREGLVQINAKIFVDASGDADVAFKAGAPFEKAGEIAPAQTLTTTFKVGGVDYDKALANPHSHLSNLMKEANRSGKYNLPREEGSIHITPMEGVMLAIMTKMEGFDPCDSYSLTKAEIEGRKQVREYVRFLVDNVEGYEKAQLIGVSNQVGVRESRRIIGEYLLEKEDVISGKTFEDAIGLCGTPIEDHRGGKDTAWQFIPGGKTYQIPYRSLLPKQVSNLIVSGRCFSATHDAHASCRSLGQTYLMGQAAGVAAAQSLDEGVVPKDISISKLQKELIKLGSVL